MHSSHRFLMVTTCAILGLVHYAGAIVFGAEHRNTGISCPTKPLTAIEAISDSFPTILRLPDEIADRLRRVPFRRPDDLHQPPSLFADTKAETILLSESFEESWPAAPWSVMHSGEAADVDWGRTNFRASDGLHSIWCAGFGPDSPGQGGETPINTSVWTIAGPFDLSEATKGSLTFDLWLKTEAFNDVFMWLVSTNGQDFSGSARSTNTDGWKSISADLNNWGKPGDVTGESMVWIAFVYETDHSNTYEGAYVDNVTLIGDSGTPADDGYTYTTNEDFALGDHLGVEADKDMLQLSPNWTTFSNLWVPNNLSGSVSKVDTLTGNELARYRTGPDRILSPIAIAVDLDGSCWVGNYNAGTVVKVGLHEGGACIDHNNNGTIETSTDSNSDGNIGNDEILPWGSDECVLYEIVLVDEKEGTYLPGSDHGAWKANGLRGLAIDADNNVWASVSGSSRFYRVDGSSGGILDSMDSPIEVTGLFDLVVDRHDILWSAVWPDPRVLRFDPASDEITAVEIKHGSFGLALDDSDHLMISGYADALFSQLDITNSDEIWSTSTAWQAAGVTATQNGDLWVAATGSATVSRHANDGIFRSQLSFTNLPTKVALDAGGKLWVVGAGNDIIVRMNPDTNQVELQKELLGGGGHEAAGDMTGIVPRTVTTQHGTWTVIWDSLSIHSAWGTISWEGTELAGTSITVRVRSSTDQRLWSNWETATNAGRLVATPLGRYIQIEVSLQIIADSESPVLEELTVKPNTGPGPRVRRGGSRVSP